ncbi:hypothetical protein HQ865_01290 [Mucilaginibacter mali]|uniref:Uncharacterized protein n=1 Tax=Mucilaginibacter mali TaxID=2740462 RepID=A0A7D4QPB0_9SPHI|nr:hypothetical protein [Mucilaginibacter mali]QKJ28449.1 hypothetical protein HQ865_01290 [Mucilaginibacter mali]
MENTIEVTPEFMAWVHALTLAGYDREIIINLADGAFIVGLYNAGVTPAAAIEKYAEFIKGEPQPSDMTAFWAARKKTRSGELSLFDSNNNEPFEPDFGEFF